jgi:hypothetical protein
VLPSYLLILGIGRTYQPPWLSASEVELVLANPRFVVAAYLKSLMMDVVAQYRSSDRQRLHLLPRASSKSSWLTFARVLGVRRLQPPFCLQVFAGRCLLVRDAINQLLFFCIGLFVCLQRQDVGIRERMNRDEG